MIKTVLFDIDGTIADITHRRGYLDDAHPDWNRFNDAMGDDTPNGPVVSFYKTLWSSGEYDLIFLTGRHEKFRGVTEQWLAWNEIPFAKLLMRKNKDNRADHLVKEEILDQLLSKGASIEFVVDDRQQVVDMWRRRGITCFQCDVGDF